MHLWPRRRGNLGPFQDVPPVPAIRHPQRLEPNPHHCTARRMADTVPGIPKTRHHPRTDRDSRGGRQGACPHCSLHPATHPRGQPRGNGSAHATDRRCPNSPTTDIRHPQTPAACSQPTPGRADAPPQTPVVPTVRLHPVTYPTTPPPPSSPRTIHHARHRRGTHEHHRQRTRTNQHARTTSPHALTPPSVHRYRQPPASAYPLCVRQRLPETALPCNPDHCVCL